MLSLYRSSSNISYYIDLILRNSTNKFPIAVIPLSTLWFQFYTREMNAILNLANLNGEKNETIWSRGISRDKKNNKPSGEGDECINKASTWYAQSSFSCINREIWSLRTHRAAIHRAEVYKTSGKKMLNSLDYSYKLHTNRLIYHSHFIIWLDASTIRRTQFIHDEREREIDNARHD